MAVLLGLCADCPAMDYDYVHFFLGGLHSSPDLLNMS